MINTKSFAKLQEHYLSMGKFTILDMFKDQKRMDKFSFNLEDLHLDVSKNLFNEDTLNLFIDLAKELNIKQSIKDMFQGEPINFTENRSVLHIALRDKNYNLKYATEIKTAKKHGNRDEKTIMVSHAVLRLLVESKAYLRDGFGCSEFP